jgi:cysteine desulfurase
MSVYLDWNSYGLVAPKVLEEMGIVAQRYCNPASKHSWGQESKRKLHELQAELLDKVGAKGWNVVFTSGASEANIAVLKQYSRVFVSSIEHPSVQLCTHAIIVPVDQNGELLWDKLEEQLSQEEPGFLLSYMLANHETGIINDVTRAAALAHKYGGFLHTDATQAFGRIDLDLSSLGCDYITIASHKCGGPIGVGALVYAPHIHMNPFSWGNSVRIGTVALPLIAGMVRSLDLPKPSNQYLENRLSCKILGQERPRLPNTTCVICSNKTELLMQLDIMGIYVSSGSACTSGYSDRASSVYAMGIDSDTIRISSGWSTIKSDFDSLLQVSDL